MFDKLRNVEAFSIYASDLGVKGSNAELSFERKDIFSSDARISPEVKGSGIFYQTKDGNATLSVFENLLSFTYHEKGDTYFLTSGKFVIGKTYNGIAKKFVVNCLKMSSKTKIKQLVMKSSLT